MTLIFPGHPSVFLFCHLPLNLDCVIDTYLQYISSSDSNTLVEAVSFSSIGKVQPFLVSIGTNACFVLDLHCHLTMSEVCGYLGGSWDVNTHSKYI